MGFLKIQTAFTHTKIPNLLNTDSDFTIWQGEGLDRDLRGIPGGDFDNFIIIEDIKDYVLRFNGSNLTLNFEDVNGYAWWGRTSGGCFYKSNTYGWIWCDKYPGYEPIENRVYNEATEKWEWKGDNFYSGNFPSAKGTQKLIPRGRNKQDDENKNAERAKEISIKFPRWASDKEFGEYKGTDGATGKKMLGVPKWHGSDGKDYIRSVRKGGASFSYTYGEIRKINGKWILGNEGSASGWWEGNEPESEHSATFTFKKNEDSDAQGNDITLSWVAWVIGNEKQTGYMGQVAICY